MSLNMQMPGIHTPIGSFLCNYIDEGSWCSDIYVPEWGKALHMNDRINLTGDELWMYCSERKAFYFHCKYKFLNQDEYVSYDHMLSNRLLWVPDNRKLSDGDFSGGLGDLIYIHDDSFNGSIDSFKRWLREESENGSPIQILFSLEKPFILSVDFTNHAKYYGFENTFIETNFLGRKETIRIG